MAEQVTTDDSSIDSAASALSAGLGAKSRRWRDGNKENGMQWIDPNDKTQKQYLPHIGEKCLFAHDGKTYYGHHTGGSFQTGAGVTAKNFGTWDCVWMSLPEAPNYK